MDLFKDLKGLFAPLSQTSEYEDVLRQNALYNARNVGGQFALNNENRQALKAQFNRDIPAVEGMIFVTQEARKTGCGTYLVYKDDTGQMNFISLINAAAKPGDIKTANYDTARKSAHQWRAIFSTSATLLKPEVRTIYAKNTG